MNGRPGDHPLTDILFYSREVYGREADELIRKVRELCSERELYEWWEKDIHWSGDRAMVLRKVQTRLEELATRKGIRLGSRVTWALV